MRYLIVTLDQNLLEYIEDKYHTDGRIPCGVIIETSGVIIETNEFKSETETIFVSLEKAYPEAEFSVFRCADVHPVGRQRSIMDACSTAWA